MDKKAIVTKSPWNYRLYCLRHFDKVYYFQQGYFLMQNIKKMCYSLIYELFFCNKRQSMLYLQLQYSILYHDCN